ncbi:Crp/Fnr family transcriptional regulator [Pseudotamlana carrageenivorans]|uniref:Crp/Fnr family transcriptional regulator n=1 Tax=Pseudotamlana carrageenivorans TaxID=2069432 RepID=A0A2I7SM89_9FLAO|nr:Crp/Fnr family transcriptional regulator [Tamlana carrageenivorans]AUS07019.1 Crp/Fnr family transcriptional regulator [Tamlana carrageenivorans]
MRLSHANDGLNELKANPLFNDVSDNGLNLLLEHAVLENWPKRFCFLGSTKTLRYFYIIRSGRLKVYFYNPEKDRKITLFIITKHDVFDLYHLLNWNHHDVNYEALDDLQIYALPLPFLQEWMRDHVAFYKNALQYIIIKMKSLESSVTSSNLDTTATRLAKLLLQHTNETTQKIEIINGLPHKELAQLIGTTRAVLNRNIQQFKEDGIIEIKNKQIEITNMNLLINKAKK